MDLSFFSRSPKTVFFFAQQGLLTAPMELKEQEKDKIETQGTMAGLYNEQKTEVYQQ